MPKFPLRPGPVVLAALLALGPGPDARAQSPTARDAWEALQAFVGATGATLATTGLIAEADMVRAQGAVLRAGGEPPSFEMILGELRIEPRDGRHALIPPPSFELVLRDGGTEELRRYRVEHDGVFLLEVADDRFGLGAAFPALRLAQTEALRGNQPLDEAFDLDLADLNGNVVLTLADPIDLTGDFTAARLAYRLSVTEAEPMPMRQFATSDTEALALTFSARGLVHLDESSGSGWLGRAFAAGFAAEAELLTGPGGGEVDQTFGDQTLAMTLRAEDSAMRFTARDGALSLDLSASGYDTELRTEAASGTVRLGRLALGLTAPVVVAPEDGTFGFRFELSDLSVDEGLLAPIGAAGFAGDTASLRLDLQGRGRWLVEITEEPPGDAELPLEISAVTLADLRARIGQSSLTGSGAFTFTPGSFGRSDTPDGTGDFVFELVGGEALLNRLGAAGLLPPDQQFLARMMMNGLGRPVGADHLRSEVAIRPGGQITVNGAPLPF